VKGQKFSRRLLLGGAGAVVTLPLFESLIGDAAYADDSFPARLICYYAPNGMHMAAWTPTQTGSDYTLSPILQPLAPVKDQILVLSGLANLPARPDGPGDHAGGTSGFLTSAHANKSETEIRLGISMDQVIANQLGGATRIPSMQIGIDGGGNSGGCDSGYSCAYARNISWASETQPLSKTTSPGVVFNQIFDGTDPNASIEEQERRKLYKTSVLDYVHEQTQALEQKLGYVDRAKLDQYTTGISELEKRLDKAGLVCGASAEPSDTGDVVEKIRIMNDLMVLALQCDATRVITFMLGNAGSNRSYPFLGANDGHHNYSHHQGNPVNHTALQAIDTWEIEQLSYLLQRMNEVPEGTGTLLQHSQVFFSCEIEDGDAHRHRNLPVILAGECHGAYNTGRHIDYEPNKSANGPPIANLFLSMMAAMGVNQSSFGDDSTGPLGQLG
jgi:hypothetical protein